MPADIWYGGDVEVQIGRRADAITPPTVWQSISFMTLSINPNQEWRDRPLLGVAGARQNPLDPTKPRKGIFRLAGELVIDADSRTLPLWLRYAMGTPVSTSSGGQFSHVFSSGQKAEQYFDLAVKVGPTDVRFYQGLTMAQFSFQAAGENTRDFNINISLAGLSRTKGTTMPSLTPVSAPEEAPMLRAVFKVDNVAASNTLSASFSYTRTLQEGLYLSASPTISAQNPTSTAHSGSATFRAIGLAFDVMEEADTPFGATIELNGVITNHLIRLEHQVALLAATPIAINGPGLIERSINWSPYQTAGVAAARIVVLNDVTTYASA